MLRALKVLKMPRALKVLKALKMPRALKVLKALNMPRVLKVLTRKRVKNQRKARKARKPLIK